MRIAVLAVQGAFIEHENILNGLGAECVELRKSTDLIGQEYDGIVLPGGESTVQSKLLHELGMYDDLKQKIEEGIPVLATCAGLILLAEELSNNLATHFATLPVTVKRNAYGRQLGSFSYDGYVKGISEGERQFPLEFIRAPYIEKLNSTEVQPFVIIDYMTDGTTGGENVVGVRYKNQIAMAFHPELTEDTRIHEMFLSLCKECQKRTSKNK